MQIQCFPAFFMSCTLSFISAYHLQSPARIASSGIAKSDSTPEASKFWKQSPLQEVILRVKSFERNKVPCRSARGAIDAASVCPYGGAERTAGRESIFLVAGMRWRAVRYALPQAVRFPEKQMIRGRCGSSFSPEV